MTRSRGRLGRGGIAVLGLALATSGCAYIARVSDSGSPTAPVAATAKGSSSTASVSSDGRYVAFQSAAADLVANDTNGVTDIFVRDRSTGAVEAASVSSGGTLGSTSSFQPRISPNGRFVVFESSATNLVLGDTNGVSDVFLRDRQAGTTQRVSVGAGGVQATALSGSGWVSADGRYVGFISSAPNLVAGDTNGADDFFVRDLQTATTTRASVGAAGVQSNAEVLSATMSANGRFVAFDTGATNLVTGDTNGVVDVFVRDRTGATTARVSVATGGAQANADSATTAISADGRYVEFESTATNLVAGDTNALRDVFLRDRTGATTTRVSVGAGGAQANGASRGGAVSADGRYVSFSSSAANLGGNTAGAVYRRDRTTGTTVLISRSTAGATANGSSSSASISSDGTVVAFSSNATNLAGSDTNGASDVFARTVSTNTTDTVSRHGTFQGNDHAYQVSTSLDGRYVAFTSYSSDLVPGDTNGNSDVFVRDTLTGSVRLVSARLDGTVGLDESSSPSISADGRWVAFQSDANDLTVNSPNGFTDVFLRDLGTGTTRLVNAGVTVNNASFAPSVSADGQSITFVSSLANLVPGDTNGQADVFVADLTPSTTTITRVSVSSASLEANSSSTGASISPDGRFVAFSSAATNLVSGDTNASSDVFLRDRTAGTTTRLSVSTAGSQATGGSSKPSISADGRFVAFESNATNLVAGDTNALQDVFVRDRQNGTTTRVSVGAGSTQADSPSTNADISGDGRYVVFLSQATNLVAGDTNGQSDIFVRDQVTGRTTRASTTQQLAEANNSSGQRASSFSPPAISADGRYVAFTTTATNLVEPDGNGAVNDIVIRANPVPTITSATPTSVARGATATITVNGANFLPGVSSYFGDKVTVTNTNRVSESQVKFTITVASNAATGARNVIVYLPGTGPGALTGAAAQFTLTVT